MTNYVPVLADEEVDPAALNSRFGSLDTAIENIKDGTATQTLPTISSFTNAQHNHENAAGGGQITLDALDSTGAANGEVPVADGAGAVAWGEIGQIPVGAVLPYAGATAPSGYLLCDGQAVSRVTYAALFALISTTYGLGDGSLTFNVPDLRGRFPLGKDDMGGSSAGRVTATEADNLGQGSGAESHVLTESEMPAHQHNERYSNTLGGNINLVLGTGSGGANNFLDATNLTGTNGVTAQQTGATGGGGAHNNMPPYATLNYIIKT